ncbi:serine hydrolase domain-containing protein [Corallococcus caeni]|uniref:Beta-lactamase-related domain-containing protein n=1 Tax=Corallococcus caeni TaxID=3082388 RepID=A0ABQ6QJD2_9BACT|nr:hypothetical protein ASNO1_03970 [Corallococcus sp. NO1]
MSRKLLVSSFLLLGLSSAPALAAGTLPKDRHAQVDALFAPWGTKSTPGCAVGISHEGTLDHARGYGMSNLEDDGPITPRSVFLIASIAKQFTAFSIGRLAQEGKLSLDDDIRKHLPELPAWGKPITVAHLMHHTNGLREQGQLLNLAGWRGDDIYTEADILWALSRQRGVNFEPGAEVLYGNAAYTLLGIIVRRVSGQSLRAFTDERIFEPLGMTNTHFRDDHSELVPRRAWGYGPRESGGWRLSVPNTDHYGSSNLFTTVGDLMKWEQNLLDGRVGGQALVTWMRTSGRLNDGTVTGYGGGLRLAGYRGLRMVSHDGMEGGYRTEALLFPDHRLSIVTLCNGGNIDAGEFARKVADVYLGKHLKDVMPPAVKLAEAKLAELAGNYWSPQTDEVVRLEFKDGALRQVGVPTAFVPIGNGAFRPGESMHLWRFSTPKADDAEVHPPGRAPAHGPGADDVRGEVPQRRARHDLHGARRGRQAGDPLAPQG